MNKQAEIEIRCRDVLRASADAERVVEILREAGYSKVTSLPIVVRVMGIPLADAKTLVHNSTTWRDVRVRDETFQSSLTSDEKGR